MIRFRTASGEIVSPGGDPNVKKGMVPTPPLKGNAVFSASAPMADPRDARIATLEAENASLKARVAALTEQLAVTPAVTERNATVTETVTPLTPAQRQKAWRERKRKAEP